MKGQGERQQHLFQIFKSIASREARASVLTSVPIRRQRQGTYEKGKGTEDTVEGRRFYRCRPLISDANSKLRFFSVPWSHYLLSCYPCEQLL